jgi:molecular chaperone Hsp33
LAKVSIKDYIKAIDGNIMEEFSLEWKCTCSENKMLNVAKTLSKKDQEELISKYGFVEVICNFCKNKYQFKKIN